MPSGIEIAVAWSSADTLDRLRVLRLIQTMKCTFTAEQVQAPGWIENCATSLELTSLLSIFQKHGIMAFKRGDDAAGQEAFSMASEAISRAAGAGSAKKKMKFSPQPGDYGGKLLPWMLQTVEELTTTWVEGDAARLFRCGPRILH